MSIAYWCVFFAGVMPVMWQGSAKFMIRNTFNNNAPRASIGKAEGMARRASWAHDNSWEAFAPFAAAVIIATLCQADEVFINNTALLFIAARIAFGLAYIFDKATLRSMVWTLGFGCVAALYLAAAGII